MCKTLKKYRVVFYFIVLAAMGLFALIAIPKPPLLEGVSFSKPIYGRNHRVVSMTLTKDHKYRLYTPISKISPILIQATLLKEDKYFHYHPGPNPFSLVRAAWQTYVVQERRIGGSTITMQLAKIRYRIHSRVIPGKLFQIVKALQLEWHYTKPEILEAYLNFASYGGNIEGVGAASWLYFGKAPDRLSFTEALTLSVIPQHPALFSPWRGKRRALKEARDRLFQKWVEHYPEGAPGEAPRIQPVRFLPAR